MNYFLDFLNNYFKIIKNKWYRNYSVNILFLYMYFANFFKEKRNADYKVYTFSLFFTKIATQETHPHP